MADRKRSLLITLAVVVLTLVAYSSSAQQPKDPKSPPKNPKDPNFMWKVTQQVFNDTPYQLRMLSKTLTENTQWSKEPVRTLNPGEKDVQSFWNDTPGHGLVGHVVYGAYDRQTGAFKAMVIARSGIDCTLRTEYTCIPEMFHRWEAVVCDSNGAVKGTWDDNAGDPENFWTGIHFVTKGGGCVGLGTPPTPPARDPQQADANYPVPWRVTGNYFNDSPFLFKLRNVWNSEATHFGDLPKPLTISPPVEIKPGESRTLAWAYVNWEKYHGPSAIIMYDAFDPRNGNKYVGSITFDAAVDCKGITDKGCANFESWSRDSADAIPGYRLTGQAQSTGLPPFGFEVNNDIVGGGSGQ